MARSATPHIGILGSGITGMTAAFYLLRAGVRVTIFESRPQPGGLATSFDFGPFQWDKFYHCILTSDRPLQKLIEDLGLDAQLRWTETKVGFYTEQGLYPMSSSLDFLRFPLLSMWEKFRLGLGVLYASRIRDGRKLQSIPVADWLKDVFGQGNYHKIWSPLLKCKLGACREEASAAFIWATIFRLYSTRDRSAGHKERLGYVTGGYRTVFSRLLAEIERMGGSVLCGHPVERVESGRNGGVDFCIGTRRFHFSGAIATSPSEVLAATAPELSETYRRKLRAVKYLGLVCVVLVLKRSLTPYYCTNVTTDVPFTGVIEMTNLISRIETQGRHLVYLPKYLPPGDAVFEASDEDIYGLFTGHLRKMFADLEDSDVEQRFIFRERLVQPLPVLNYTDIAPSMETGIPGLLLANTTQIINSTLNNNAMVQIARNAVDRVLQNTAVSDPRTSHCLSNYGTTVQSSR